MDMMIQDSIAKELVPTNVGESPRKKIVVNNPMSPEGREAANNLRYLYPIQGKSHLSVKNAIFFRQKNNLLGFT